MKTEIKFLLVIFILLFFFIAGAEEKQKTEWKGTIKYENGVKVIKNPEEPLFGEIEFDIEQDLNLGKEDDNNYLFYQVRGIALDKQENIYVLDSGNFRVQKFDKEGRYLQTIGRKGQGPGEFEKPARIFLDNQGNLYVADGKGRRGNSRLIKIFNAQGKFVKSIHLENSISDFYVDSGGNILANVTQGVEGGTKSIFVIMSPEGKIIKNIAEFSDVKEVRRKSGEMKASFRVHHLYTPRLMISRINEKIFSYAYSSDYQIFVIDNDGNLRSSIQKKENFHSISQKEKKRIIEKIGESISRGGTEWPEGVLEKACSFPSMRPFFSRIIVDDMQRLYLWRVKSVLDKSEKQEFDVFSKEGYFLYRAKIAAKPVLINKGYLFDIKEDEETGKISVRRFRIKNWDQIKTGI
jgi:hypothetical protein